MNEALCDGLDNCTYFKTREKERMPVYWEKVFRVNETMKAHQKCDIVAYLDSDAVIRKKHVDFFDKRMGDKHALVSGDEWHDMNAGVWAVRNTREGNEIMDNWETLYGSSTGWKQTKDGKWKCKGCLWGGSQYEQGSFCHVSKQHKHNIMRVAQDVLNNKRCIHPTASIKADVCHFMGWQKKDIENYANRVEEHDRILARDAYPR